LGVDLSEIIPKKPIMLNELAGRTLAVDAYNTLYQFLAIIRQPDGTPLMDHQGRVTSHLSGILYRTSNLIEMGMRLVYVFDGEPPELKEMEIRRRVRVKEEATVRYERALKEGRMEEARTYAQATSRLKDLMVEDSKRLLKAMGVPFVQAPSEGEAQAAAMAAKGDVWAVASQDHDSILFGAPTMLKNLTISGRRKLPRKDTYVEVEAELISLEDVLSSLELTRQQLIDLGILIGTDFNPDGVKGIGPKTALKLVREHGSLEKIVEQSPDLGIPSNLDEIRRIFLQPNVTFNYTLEFGPPNTESIVDFLCRGRDFTEDRVRKAVEKMTAGLAEAAVKKSTLDSYFG
jgi:flap endonuclease-1